MTRRRPSRLLPSALTAALLLTGGVIAETPRGEVVLPLDPGLYVVGVGFFSANFSEVEETEEGKQVRVRFGELDAIRWKEGSLPTLDAHVLVANLTGLWAADLPVRVTIFFGLTPEASVPPLEEIVPGAKGIAERRFFQRTYHMENLAPTSLGRISVRDIRLQDAIADYTRQKIWPVYLRVEAELEAVGKEVDVPRPVASAHLPILP